MKKNKESENIFPDMQRVSKYQGQNYETWPHFCSGVQKRIPFCPRERHFPAGLEKQFNTACYAGESVFQGQKGKSFLNLLEEKDFRVILRE